MDFRKLSVRLRIAKYLIENFITLNKTNTKKNRKLKKLYCRIGDYDSAVKYAESIYKSECRVEDYHILKNLYTLSSVSELSVELDIKNKSEMLGDIISIIGNIDEVVYDLDKFKFIKDYVKSKGAKPLFICLSGKGGKLKNKTKDEKLLLSDIELYDNERQRWIKENNAPSYIKKIYKDYNNVNFSDLFNSKPPVVKATKVLLGDMENSYVSVRNGIRTTTGQPSNFDNRILFYGTSTTYSVGTSNEDTIVSQVQKEINKYQEHIKVENHGIKGLHLLLAINNLVQTDIKEGDVIVFFDYDEFESFKDDSIYKLDLNKFERGDDFFLDLGKNHCHFSPRGNRVLAKTMAKEILLPIINKDITKNSNVLPSEKIYKILDDIKYILFKKTAQALESCEMKSYLALLEEHVPDSDIKVGSVAVNCNPITKGHLHLLEHAARNVDKLFVFVIEEDKSFFRFEDRLRLVTESTIHLENVTVIRGGKFICTELTYPDYFDKETKETTADASMEAWFFCEYIAPKLNITKIFLGDEPKCMITNQYNQKMQELLPEYNIDVEIIDRISSNDEVISASKVRALLNVGDFEGIRKIVPEPTYRFLTDKYQDSTA
ncbi:MULTISPECIES: citrate lyase ligase [Vibrio]|uniref:citrate lyase ligase n=1 Tax=Vibrio TaxID=662 RepID=UPI00069FFBC6|nr:MULTISPECIES: citrate lyase ligase [Vibrio]KNY47460.1 citrate lyase ligase [Vibrio harveyi]MDA0123993.1 citrate lyase ligase [Vibrio sp. MM46]